MAAETTSNTSIKAIAKNFGGLLKYFSISRNTPLIKEQYVRIPNVCRRPIVDADSFAIMIF